MQLEISAAAHRHHGLHCKIHIKKIYLISQKPKINSEMKCTDTNTPVHALVALAYGHGKNTAS
jgi:hypothetical protein